MHRMKRSGAALLAVLMLGLAPAGAARASLGLPEGLAVIGEEAFRNSGIGGTVTVEEGVTALGENALSGTGVCALTLPASLTELGDQQLDGLVYLRVNGSGTQIGLASCAPRCVMAPAGSPAKAALKRGSKGPEVKALTSVTYRPSTVFGMTASVPVPSGFTAQSSVRPAPFSA